MHRFYRLDVQANLFGEWSFIREFGHIGRAGRVREAPSPAPVTDPSLHGACAAQSIRQSAPAHRDIKYDLAG
jgi:WGR domain